MSATAVPIQPTPSSSKIALWGGVAALALLGAGLAWKGTAAVVDRGCGSDAFLSAGGAVSAVETLESGIRFQIVKPGDGKQLSDAQVGIANVTLKSGDGQEMGSQPSFPLVGLTGIAPSMAAAVSKMQMGGSYRVCVPEDPKAKAQPQAPGQPPQGIAMRFEIDVTGTRSRQEMMEEQMRAMQQQQQSGGGAPPEMPVH